LDEAAIAKVFQAKRRPLTDPLIIHVNHASEAMSLWDVNTNNDNLERALRALTSKFWPGPLTLVAKANRTVVPDVVMAHTGYVACRSPSHALARQLLTCARVPIAAPSANRFGHVSPTRPTHVMDDLSSEDVWIIDPNLDTTSTNNNNSNNNACCDVGVESTVAKVTWEDNVGKVIVLRHGAVSEQDIRQCLEEAAMKFEVTSMVRSTLDHVPNVAPGQTIRHYSPDVLSYMISSSRTHMMDANNNNNDSSNNNASSWSEQEMEWLQQAVVIDFGGRLKTAEPHALAYRDLSSLGNSDEAAARVFDTLRWAENVVGAHRVYFPELETAPSSSKQQQHDNTTNDDALILAVKDRLTRAASGIIIDTLQ
jgi:L-threonylcarbamoyladenylate synthase